MPPKLQPCDSALHADECAELSRKPKPRPQSAELTSDFHHKTFIPRQKPCDWLIVVAVKHKLFMSNLCMQVRVALTLTTEKVNLINLFLISHFFFLFFLLKITKQVTNVCQIDKCFVASRCKFLYLCGELSKKNQKAY